VATADFSRGWPKRCLPGSANSGEILFYQLETMKKTILPTRNNEKNYFTKMLIGKYQISKPGGGKGLLSSLSNAHTNNVNRKKITDYQSASTRLVTHKHKKKCWNYFSLVLIAAVIIFQNGLNSFVC